MAVEEALTGSGSKDLAVKPRGPLFEIGPCCLKVRQGLMNYAVYLRKWGIWSGRVGFALPRHLIKSY